jgi:hypothetical protein
MAQQYQRSPYESQERVRSGQSTFINNRAGCLMTFLTEAGLMIEPVPTYWTWFGT